MEDRMNSMEKEVAIMAQWNIPVENLIWHYEADPSSGKTCPNYDMTVFRDLLS